MKLIGIIITIISILSVLTLLFFIISYFVQDNTKIIYSKQFNFVVTEDLSNNITSSHFYIYKKNNGTSWIFIKQGDFIKGLNQVNLTYDEDILLFRIFPEKEGYYSEFTEFYPEDDNINLYIKPFPKEKEDIIVKSIDLKKDLNNVIKIEISSEKEIKEQIHCFRWSLGIMDINGWANVEIPEFLNKLVDKCFTTKEGEYEYEISTGILNADDYLDIYILDKCVISEDNFATQIYEYKGEDCCMNTFKYKIY